MPRSYLSRVAPRICLASLLPLQTPDFHSATGVMHPIKSADNSQDKCSRYKIKLHLSSHWSDVFIALSHVLAKQLRLRIAITPNDNFNGKSSRFKGLAIVRVQTRVS